MKQKKQFLRSFLLAAGIAIAGAAMAQVDLGVRAGVNFSNLMLKDNEGKYKGVALTPGFNAGLTFDIPVADEFYVQPAALFSMKGAKVSGEADDFFLGSSEEGVNHHTILNTYYLEVPVNFVYKPQLGNGRLLLGAGPYFAYALGGKYKSDFDGDITKGNLDFANDYNDEDNDDNTVLFGKRADAGANLLVGYEFANRFSVQLNGQLGLLNLEPKDDGNKPDATIKNSGFGLSVGYKF